MQSPKSHYRHMNRTIAVMMRELYFGRRMNQVELAAFFRVRQSTVSRIIAGLTWA